MIPQISIKQLLEAGVHFGHQTKRWNPKMREYIFGERNGIYIIDLQKTLRLFKAALEFVQQLAAEGKTILFVGTKRQAQEIIAEEAVRCGMFYVNQRWLGGLLTNFSTIRKSIERLQELNQMKEGGQYEQLSKKEVSRLERERRRLEKYLAGIKEMTRLPDAIYVVDTNKEAIAIKEARKLGIPVVAIVDTNCNPEEVDFVIPGNDDALKAVKLITSAIADAIIEGRNQWQAQVEAEMLKAAAEAEAREAERQAAEEAVPEQPQPERRPRRRRRRPRRGGARPEATATEARPGAGERAATQEGAPVSVAPGEEKPGAPQGEAPTESGETNSREGQ